MNCTSTGFHGRDDLHDLKDLYTFLAVVVYRVWSYYQKHVSGFAKTLYSGLVPSVWCVRFTTPWSVGCAYSIHVFQPYWSVRSKSDIWSVRSKSDRWSVRSKSDRWSIQFVKNANHRTDQTPVSMSRYFSSDRSLICMLCMLYSTLQYRVGTVRSAWPI